MVASSALHSAIRAHLVGYLAQTPSIHETQGGARQTTGVPEGELLDPKTQFRDLYDQEFHSVFRSIRAVVLDSAAAEDLTQETFVRAYRARSRYTPTAPPGAWLRRIGI